MADGFHPQEINVNPRLTGSDGFLHKLFPDPPYIETLLKNPSAKAKPVSVGLLVEFLDIQTRQRPFWEPLSCYYEGGIVLCNR